MKIQYVDFIPGSTTPARVFHNTGVIQINKSRWDQIPDEFHKKFILKHEEGHYKGKTNNELYADGFAFNALAGTQQNSLRKSITALTDNLPMTTPQHGERITAQSIRALKYDALVNKNKKALEALKQYFPGEVENISSFEDTTSTSNKPVIVIASIIGVIILIILIIKLKK
jgi:hypothetical protein